MELIFATIKSYSSIIKSSFLNIFRRKIRSLLTLFAISISIAALTVLIGVVDGIESEATATISKLQGISVYSSSVPDPVMATIDEDYINKIKSIGGIKDIVPEYYKFASKIDSKDIGFSFTNPVFLYGINPNDFPKSSYSGFIDNIVKGRIIKNNDTGVVMLSKTFANDYKKSVGSKIEIDNIKYVVIGIYEINSTFAGNPIIINKSDLVKNHNYDVGKVNLIYVIPANPDKADTLVKKIEFKFTKLKADSQQDMMKQVGDLLRNLRIIAIIVSLVGAFVAALGVVNTMLMSVMERTKEIGTLKAVGWTKSNIITIILIESLIIGLLGAILGIILAYIGAFAISGYVNTIISLQLIIQNFLFGIALGTFGGLYPAWKASKLDPVEALRTE